MSDAQKERYKLDLSDSNISFKNMISFFNEHSDRIKEEVDNPDFEALFDKRFKAEVVCFDNFWILQCISKTLNEMLCSIC